MMQLPYIGAAFLECAGKAKRDGALDCAEIKSGVALRLPPHSKIIFLSPTAAHSARRK
jgi:hypothetical protein